MNVWNRLHCYCFGPVSPTKRLAFTQWFSLSLLCYVCERGRHVSEWLTETGFHYSAQSITPWHPAPAPLLPTWAALPFLLFFIAVTALLTLGFAERWMMCFAWLGVVYVSQADAASAFTINKLFIVVYLILLVAPRAVHREDNDESYESAWALRILQWTLLLHYAAAGFSKAVDFRFLPEHQLGDVAALWRGDWTVAWGEWMTNPDVLWSQSQGIYCTDIGAWMLRWLPQWSWTGMQWSALAFECLAPLLFLVPRWRIVGIAWGVAFHFVIALTMHKLFYFSFQMVTLYILFMEDRWLRTAQDRLDALVLRWFPRATTHDLEC